MHLEVNRADYERMSQGSNIGITQPVLQNVSHKSYGDSLSISAFKINDVTLSNVVESP
jgi:hypothetical protein